MKRNIIIGLIASVLLIAGGIWLYNNQPPKDLVKYKDPRLTAAEKKVFEDKINELQSQLSDNKNASKEDKFRWNTQLGFNYYVLGELEKAKKAQQEASKLFPGN